MRPFQTAELTRMQDTQESAMQDKCQILRYASLDDSYGNPEASYTAWPEIVCGVKQLLPREIQQSGEVPVIDAVIRFPLGTKIDSRDRIRVSWRYDVEKLPELSRDEYDIVGPVREGPSGIRVDCRLRTEG